MEMPNTNAFHWNTAYLIILPRVMDQRHISDFIFEANRGYNNG